MNRLFNALRGIREKPRAAQPALPGFENRVDVLYQHAQQAAAYEDELTARLDQAQATMDGLETKVEAAIEKGNDRGAFEYLRLAARLRPQRDLLAGELQAFHAVATALIQRVSLLIDNIDEARAYALDGAINPAATQALDDTLIRLTRYFVMLDRVAANRRRELPDRLAAQMNQVIDDRDLDLELARYVLQKRRALDAGEG